jgi:hypothetical protein
MRQQDRHQYEGEFNNHEQEPEHADETRLLDRAVYTGYNGNAVSEVEHVMENREPGNAPIPVKVRNGSPISASTTAIQIQIPVGTTRPSFMPSRTASCFTSVLR